VIEGNFDWQPLTFLKEVNTRQSYGADCPEAVHSPSGDDDMSQNDDIDCSKDELFDRQNPRKVGGGLRASAFGFFQQQQNTNQDAVRKNNSNPDLKVSDRKAGKMGMLRRKTAAAATSTLKCTQPFGIPKKPIKLSALLVLAHGLLTQQLLMVHQ
jgi:hypothetical protein